MISIRMKLTAAIVAIIGAIVLFQIIFFPLEQGRAATLALQAKAAAVGTTAAQSSAAGLEFDDAALVKEVFAGAAKDSDLIYMVLYKPDGQVLAAHHGQDAPPTQTGQWRYEVTTLLADGQVRVELPVITKSGLKGHLAAGYSTDRIDDEMAASGVRALLVSLVILGLGVALAFAVASSVGRRLDALVTASEGVARGKLDITLPHSGTDEIGQVVTSMQTMLDTLRILQDHIRGVAQGDLSGEVMAEGDLAAAIRTATTSQREMVQQIAISAASIRQASSEILASSRIQAQGANEQASVVEETLRTMDTLLASSSIIADSSAEVLEHAERTHANNKTIAERITQLAGHTERIGEILSVIKEIANKSELLALNAALEGTRAGEAGRGFSLVANQMQRLAENVMGAVRDIQQLTNDIRDATTASVLATEEATKRASSTSDSARQISLSIRQQQSGTEQVNQSMGEISEVIRQTASASVQIADSAEQLDQLSVALDGLVQRFSTGTSARG